MAEIKRENERWEAGRRFGAFFVHLSFALFTFFFVVGLRAGTKTNVNIVILLFDSNRPNLNQGLRYYLIPGLYFSVFNIWLLFL